ncbi:MAG: hypothetical protein D4Q77_00875 [Methanothrix sp.]|nr:MAG: hypothetical protein D4Q77_00875 [Methanothrix sp.]
MKKIVALLVLAMAIFVLPAVAQDLDLPTGVAYMEFDGMRFGGGMSLLITAPNTNFDAVDLGSQRALALSNGRATNFFDLVKSQTAGGVAVTPTMRAQEIVKSQSNGNTSLISSETGRLQIEERSDSMVVNVELIRTGDQVSMAAGTGIFGRAVASNSVSLDTTQA